MNNAKKKRKARQLIANEREDLLGKPEYVCTTPGGNCDKNCYYCENFKIPEI